MNVYFFETFKEDIQKMVRNYIFELDNLRGDSSYSLDKKYDYVEIYDFKETDNSLILTYRIFDKETKSPRFFDTPVEIKISKFHLLVTNFKYLNSK